MIIREIRSLYAYTEWANERMLSAIRQLSDEQYTRQLTSSFPTIRETLAHIAGAEWLWLQRWNGTSPDSMPSWATDASVDTLEREMRAVAAERRSLLEALDDEAVERPLSYRTLSGDAFTNRFADVLFHVANHSTYHRGQLTTMLRQVGAVPPSTDLIFYHRRNG